MGILGAGRGEGKKFPAGTNRERFPGFPARPGSGFLECGVKNRGEKPLDHPKNENKPRRGRKDELRNYTRRPFPKFPPPIPNPSAGAVGKRAGGEGGKSWIFPSPPPPSVGFEIPQKKVGIVVALKKDFWDGGFLGRVGMLVFPQPLHCKKTKQKKRTKKQKKKELKTGRVQGIPDSGRRIRRLGNPRFPNGAREEEEGKKKKEAGRGRKKKKQTRKRIKNVEKEKKIGFKGKKKKIEKKSKSKFKEKMFRKR